MKIINLIHICVCKKINHYQLSNGTKFKSLFEMKEFINKNIKKECKLIEKIIYSDSPKYIKF